jgi:hypothetical protein
MRDSKGENWMEQRMRRRSLRNKLLHIARMRLGLSARPPLKQLRTNARLTNLPQRTIGPGFFLADLLDVNAELPYTTVVEGLEEFLYQSELHARVQR